VHSGLIREYYRNYDEDARLMRDNAHRMEWITTTAILADHVGPDARILDAGAGTGAYSLHYARGGHSVVALDLVAEHLRKLAERAAGERLASVSCMQGDARDLSAFDGASFDVVLCMGPMYHLRTEEDRCRCLDECLRVLVPGGLLAVAYVSDNAAENVAIIMNELRRLRADCFVMDDSRQFENLLRRFPLAIVDHVATDGLARSISAIMNAMDEREFDAWVTFHIATCRSGSVFRHAFHGLVVCRKDNHDPAGCRHPS
jgi:ubiquinone/menaquinone biosynthesis C-methylase UbiE